MNIIDTIKNWNILTKVIAGGMVILILALLMSLTSQGSTETKKNEVASETVSSKDFDLEESEDSLPIEPTINQSRTEATITPVISTAVVTPTIIQTIMPTAAPTVILTKAPTTIPTVTPTVKPKQEYPDKLLVSASRVQIYPGEKQKITVKIQPADVINRKITVTNSNKNVVKISGNVEIEGLIPGNVSLTFKTQNDITQIVDVEVLVPITGVSVDVTNLTLNKGEARQISARVEPETAENKSLKWSSSNASVVSVDDEGWLIAKTTGQATITVTTANNKTNTIKVTVN